MLFLSTVFLGFFAVMNPIGNVPVFLSMIGDADRTATRRTAFRAILVAFVIITVFSIFGHVIFKLFGITLPAFQIAGGIIIFFTGFDLLSGKSAGTQGRSGEGSGRSLDDLAVSPLGIPIMAGPGTISAAMNFVGQGENIWHTLLVVLVFAVMCVVSYLMFVFGRRIATRLSPSLIRAIGRIMGLILAVIAVQMVIAGITTLIRDFS